MTHVDAFDPLGPPRAPSRLKGGGAPREIGSVALAVGVLGLAGENDLRGSRRFRTSWFSRAGLLDGLPTYAEHLGKGRDKL